MAWFERCRKKLISDRSEEIKEGSEQVVKSRSSTDIKADRERMAGIVLGRGSAVRNTMQTEI